MRHFIRILLLLLVLIIDIAAYSQTNPSKSTSSRENADRIENNLHDSVIKVENDSAKISDSISDTTSQNQKLLTQEKPQTGVSVLFGLQLLMWYLLFWVLLLHY